MKRRTFIQIGMAAAAASLLPHDTAEGAPAANAAQARASVQDGPRRVELLDAGWRFLQTENSAGERPVDDWLWTPGTPDQQAAMVSDNVDVSGWKKTAPGDDTLPENSYGWFRAVLPQIAGPGRVLHFDGVDDNGDVFLNGKHLVHHEGWNDAFDVPLDSAWRTDGPNIVTVLVQNIGGVGGITGAVTLDTEYEMAKIAQPGFDDRSWAQVHLPHDYVVTGSFDPKADAGHGFLPVSPAWYRRTLDIPADDKGKSIWLYFEGVFRNATVYINGKKAYFEADGYDPFNVDIAPYVRYGERNLIAVHVDPRSFEGWWYEGGGIYRHVWLNVADPVHVAPWGVYVVSDVHDVLSNPSADLTIQIDLESAASASTPVEVETQILGPDGLPVATTRNTGDIAGSGTLRIEQKARAEHARLWSLDDRNLYEAIVTVTSRGRLLDRFRQPFGIRTIRFDPQNGFFLNEKPVKLQGTCNHQDFCGVGIGMPDSILYYRMQKLKERLGCNAIRCSHNPMTPAMYDACDDLGLLVMDETRHPGDVPAQKGYPGMPYKNTEHIEKMILRDRNHPSVIMWSMANEEWSLQGSPFGATMLKYLMEAVHKHDKTRPITTALNAGTGPGWMVGFGSVEDLLGVNYNYGDYDWLRSQYPDKPIFGSETGSDTECRAEYTTDRAGGHLSSYMSPEGSWRPLATRAFVCGGFVWTGFDYRGEPTPFGWPEINSNFGLLDMCGFPKDAAFYYKAWWAENEPLVHIFPHWNWEGKEGRTVPVWCFSNCDEVELFINGVSVGRQTMPRYGHIEWNQCVYQPGAIHAIGYRAGHAAASDTVATTGPAVALKLSADRERLLADGEDTIPVAVSVIDSNGRVVPTAGNLVTFSVTGAGVNAGVGNGDPASHEPNQASTRSAFGGLCMVLVKSLPQPGQIVLTASSEGLKGASLHLRST